MKRSNRNQTLFWILSILVVLSMIGSSIIFIIESLSPPAPPTGPSGWRSTHPYGVVTQWDRNPSWNAPLLGEA